MRLKKGRKLMTRIKVYIRLGNMQSMTPIAKIEIAIAIPIKKRRKLMTRIKVYVRLGNMQGITPIAKIEIVIAIKKK